MNIVVKYPSNVELDVVTQEYKVDSKKFIGQQILPTRPSTAQRIEWDELDNEAGMTAAHKLGTEAKTNARPGSKTKSYEPMYFKEGEVIDERELLQARAYGTFGDTLNISELVGERNKAGMDKDFIRQEWLIWQALQGSINVDELGVKLSETIAVQEFTPVVAWNTLATAKPLTDCDAMKLMFRGTGATSEGAIMYMNQTTLNKLLENQNDNDIKGYRNSNFTNIQFSLTQLQPILKERGLPQIELYEGGYFDKDGNWQLYIPDGKAIIVGNAGEGRKGGDFPLTPSLHRIVNGRPTGGMFSFIEVNGQPNIGMMTINLEQLGQKSNPKLEVFHGFYGGPRIKFPRRIIKVNAF
jgi:hypothetical protein